MKEIDNELINVDAYKKATLSLANLEIIEKITTYVAEKTGGKTYIVSPKSNKPLYEIHFLIESNKQLDLFDLGNLMRSIAEIVGYEEIIVQPKDFHNGTRLNENFKDVVQYSKNNISEIYSFLKRNFHIVSDSNEVSNVTAVKSYSANNKWSLLQSKNANSSTMETDLEKSGKEVFESYFSADKPINETKMINFLKGFINTANSCGLDGKSILNAISPSISRHQSSK